MFGKKDDTDNRRTPREVQEDPSITDDYVVVPDDKRREYTTRGYRLVEDLAGSDSLMKKES